MHAAHMSHALVRVNKKAKQIMIENIKSAESFAKRNPLKLL